MSHPSGSVLLNGNKGLSTLEYDMSYQSIIKAAYATEGEILTRGFNVYSNTRDHAARIVHILRSWGFNGNVVPDQAGDVEAVRTDAELNKYKLAKRIALTYGTFVEFVSQQAKPLVEKSEPDAGTWQEGFRAAVNRLVLRKGTPVDPDASSWGWIHPDWEDIRQHVQEPGHVRVSNFRESTWYMGGDTDTDGTDEHGVEIDVRCPCGKYAVRYRYHATPGEMLLELLTDDA